jgi:hypothetical protein
MITLSSKKKILLKNSVLNTNTIQYSVDNGKSWINITSWPVSLDTQRVNLQSDLVLGPNTTGTLKSGTDLYFIINKDLNFNGNNFIVKINDINQYNGLIQNGSPNNLSNESNEAKSLEITNLGIISSNSTISSDTNTNTNTNTGIGAGWLLQSYLNNYTKPKNILIEKCFVQADINSINNGGFIGSNCGKNVTINNSYFYTSQVVNTTNTTNTDRFIGSNSDPSNKINNSYLANGSWSDLEALNKLKGCPEYKPDGTIQTNGIYWGQKITNTPYIFKSFQASSREFKFSSCSDYNLIKNILLIDYTVVQSEQFFNSVNTDTLAIIYYSNSTSKELVNFLKTNFTQLSRIGFVFNNININSKLFIDNSNFFIEKDLENNTQNYSTNIELILWICSTFNIGNIDYLACESLKHDDWKSYFNLLNKSTGVIVGASDDLTGNVKYGGDWVLESTGEDIEQIYWTNSIKNYTGLLGTELILSYPLDPLDTPGTLYFQQIDSTSALQYQYGSTSGDWTDINLGTEWPITIINSNPAGGVLTVSFFTDITINGTTVGVGANGYFIVGSEKITFEGNLHDITIDRVTTGYNGLIQNGTSSTNGNANIIVQNINLKVINGSILNFGSGWITWGYFSKSAIGCEVNLCTNSGVISGFDSGGIFGYYAGAYSGSVTATDCSSTGNISGESAGGIFGKYAGAFGGSVTVTNCSSTGNISGGYSGGIFGAYSGQNDSIATATGCSNTGIISGANSGGIFGSFSGNNNGSVTATGCSSTGLISGSDSGGIFGAYSGQENGSATATSCSNAGLISGFNSGGIFGGYSGENGGSASATDCSSTGNISGGNAGGIFGIIAGGYGGSATVTNCSSTGNISGGSAGGIFGLYAGYTGSVTATNCSSTGEISGKRTGGVFGGVAGAVAGSAIATNCSSTGDISGESAGGIFGYYAGNNNGSATATGCSSTGEISGSDSGGIFGSYAGYGYGSAVATNCSSTGEISGEYSGGIFGAQACEYYGSAVATNCYTQGNVIGTDSFGIFGINPGNYGGAATATNCYYNNLGTNLSATFTNCYSYNNAWSDSDAITNLDSTTTPTYTGTTLTNPIGTVWADPDASDPNVPYIFSSFGLSPYTIPSATLDQGQTSQNADVITLVNYSIIAIANSTPADPADSADPADPVDEEEKFDPTDPTDPTNPTVSDDPAVPLVNPFITIDNSTPADPSVYPFITIDPTTGAISVDISGIVGIYTVYVYQIFVSSGIYSVSTFDLTILEARPPTITTQPVSQTVISGSTVTFSVDVDGTTPFDYQWYFLDEPIESAYSSTYTIDSVTSTNAGNYSVQISNSVGEITSDNAVLTIIVICPNQIVSLLSTATLYVNVYGSEPINYQWYFQDVPIEGANSSTYIIDSVFIENLGSYYVIITNDNGDTPSSSTILETSNTILSSSVTLTQSLFNTYIWPVIINNGTSSTPTIITQSENIIINNSSNYFIFASEYITFNGNNYTININDLNDWAGLFQNGREPPNGFSNCTIQNVGLIASNSILTESNGWICQKSFAVGAINNLISNCYSTGDITTNGSGGICGAAFSVTGGSSIISLCYSTGNISGEYSGGICGSYAGAGGNCSINNSYSYGIISGNSSGGICGGYPGTYGGQCSANNCYSMGNISGSNSGGIFGNDAGRNGGFANITNCFSYGTISGSNAGGLQGFNSISNLTNTYVANSSWSDSDAITYLTGTPTYIGTTLSNPIGTVWTDPDASNSNVPYIFSSFGLSPYTNPTANLYPGQTSQPANVITGVTYSICAISNSIPAVPREPDIHPREPVIEEEKVDITDSAVPLVNPFITIDNSTPADPSVYPFITINPTTGAISVGTSEFVYGNYVIYVYQTNSLGEYSVSTFALTIISGGTSPTITTQPESQTVLDGSIVTFSVVASGTPPLNYQWVFDTIPISGANSSTYTINPVTSVNAGNYSVVVSNYLESITSSDAELIVNSPPTIIIQPQSQSANINSFVIFSVDATGSEPLSYQWEFNNIPISGANSLTYTIDPVTLTNAGNYNVVVSNDFGSIISSRATLTVVTTGAPTITTEPVSQTVKYGSPATFTVVATGPEPLTYQWVFNDLPIEGATNSTYLIESASLTDAGTYFVTVTNNIGSVTSVYVELDVVEGEVPTITTQPQSQTVQYGSQATFTVVATGSEPLTFQWYKNNSIIEGATNSTYLINNTKTKNQGVYYVIITNIFGFVQSIDVVLKVIEQTVIIKQPQSQKVKYNCPVTFYVQAIGSQPLTYQWYKNNNPIINATLSSLTIPRAKCTDIGEYYVVIKNILNTKTTSNIVYLKVENKHKSKSKKNIDSNSPIKIPIAVLIGLIIYKFIKK